MLTAVIVGYDAKLRPSLVKCGLCGERLPSKEPWLASSDENFAWVEAQFELHAEQKHVRKPIIEPAQSHHLATTHSRIAS
jgi:hypothetical protein